ncbi:mucin-binding protein, partial [Oenococcus oeni]|uniref:mucin-binding protein n=1 Tax=Oenococcus oeni TaxID=1247 RepID=UPI000A93D218
AETVYYSTTATSAELNPETGVPEGSDWTQANSDDFASVTNPTVAGYSVISNNAPASDLAHVASQTVTNTSDDLNYTVVYALNVVPPIKPSQPSKPSTPSKPSQPSKPTVSGKPSAPNDSIHPYVNKPSSNKANNNYSSKKQLSTSKVTGVQEESIIPQTSESNHKDSVLITGLSALVLSITSFIGLKFRKRD